VKISIARATELYPRHIVVRHLLVEDWKRRMMLQRIVGRSVQLERHQETMIEASSAGRDAPEVVYRFAMKYLDDLLLAFPMAEMSPALSRKIIKKAKDEIRNTPVPDLNFRGFQMYDRADNKVDLFDFQKIVVGMGIDALMGKRGVAGQVSQADQTEVLSFFNNLEMGLGKGFAFTEPVSVPGGWTPIGALKVGDKVAGRDGTWCSVTAVFDRPILQLFRVTLRDGSSVVTDPDHRWAVQTLNDRFRGGHRVLTTAQMLATGCSFSNGNARYYSLMLTAPVQHPDRELPLDPYVMGCMLGDGSCGNSTLCNVDEWLIDEFERRLPAGCQLTRRGVANLIVRTSDQKRNPFTKIMKDHGWNEWRSSNKYAPVEYLTASPAQRLDCLRGLMDTDGWIQGANSVQFASTSEALRDGVQELVRSLGGTARTSYKVAKLNRADGTTATCDAFTTTIAMPPGMNPFLLPRKADLYHDREKYLPSQAIVSIEPEGRGRSRCITVDAPDSLFVGKDYIVTHNTACAEATLVALHRNLIRLRKKRGEKNVTDVSILVIIPNNAKQAWIRALNKNTRLDAAIVEGTFAQREAIIKARHDVTIVNFETIRASWNKVGRRRETWVPVPKHPSLFDHEYFAVVCDEYHRVKNPEAQQSIGYLHLNSKKFMPMSGTPILSKPEEAWVTLHKSWPHLFPSYENFVRILQVKDGGEMLGYNPEVMIELKKFLMINSVRIRKDQVMDQLPKELYIQKDVELTKEQRRIYNKIRDEMLLTLDNGDVRDIMSPLAMIIRLKQAAFSPELFDGSKHSAKIDELREDVVQLISSGEKAIIGSQWAKATRILQREFASYNPAYVDGTVVDTRNNLARTNEVDRFNNDPDCLLYIGTIGANKEAITLHAATYVAMTDKDWTPANNRQFVMRSAAGGLRGLDSGVSSVSILEYIAKDTIEEAIEVMLMHKQNVFNSLVERDGGFQASRSTFKDIMSLIRKA
jgi:hypothetical protein